MYVTCIIADILEIASKLKPIGARPGWLQGGRAYEAEYIVRMLVGLFRDCTGFLFTSRLAPALGTNRSQACPVGTSKDFLGLSAAMSASQRLAVSLYVMYSSNSGCQYTMIQYTQSCSFSKGPQRF